MVRDNESMLLVMKGFVDICTQVTTHSQLGRSITQTQQVCQLGPGTILNEPRKQTCKYSIAVHSEELVCVRVSYEELATTLAEIASDISEAANSRDQYLQEELTRKVLINSAQNPNGDVLVDQRFERWSKHASPHLFSLLESEFSRQSQAAKLKAKAQASDLSRVARVDPDLCLQISTPAVRLAKVRKSMPSVSFGQTQNRMFLSTQDREQANKSFALLRSSVKHRLS